MAMGGGTFAAMNKVIPGTYINVVSKVYSGQNNHDRGTVACAFDMDWGLEGTIFKLDASDASANAIYSFGYDYSDDKMVDVREIFSHAVTLVGYRLNSGGVKASNVYAEAKCPGTRGNAIQIVIASNVDDTKQFDVKTVIDKTMVDKQTVASASDLAANSFVTFKSAELKAGIYTMTGGTNGVVTNANYSEFLSALEKSGESVNVIACPSTEADVQALYVSYIKRMRDSVGVDMQVAMRNNAADFEGVINVKNKVKNTGNEAEAVYWTAGAEAGKKVGESCTNMTYDGELEIDTDYLQSELKDAAESGEFVFHKVGNEVRVLLDINSLTTFTKEKPKLLQSNDVIRTIDDLSMGEASIFNDRYAGKFPNKEANRTALWSDIVDLHKEVEALGGIENFNSKDVTVQKGTEKGDVVITSSITVTEAMQRLYVTTVIQ